MGVIFRARHISLGTSVAVKFMRPRFADRPALRTRFRREAQAAARLRSPYVARIMDVGSLNDGVPYIVMELLEGQDLGAMLERQGRLEVGAAVDLLLQACAGMIETHAAGVVHRDLKPSNLFVTTDATGQPAIKILDFGVSKAAIEIDESLVDTAQGAVIGTPHYMSPEQMRDPRSVDERTDVWALGAILYRMVTGEHAFPGDTLPVVCARVLNDPIAPYDTNTLRIPAELERLINRCLTKDRRHRFQAVTVLARELIPFASRPELGALIAKLGAGEVAPSSSQDIHEPAQAGRSAELGETVAETLSGDQARVVSAQAVSRSRPRWRWAVLAAVALLAMGFVLVDRSGTTTSRSSRDLPDTSLEHSHSAALLDASPVPSPMPAPAPDAASTRAPPSESVVSKPRATPSTRISPASPRTSTPHPRPRRVRKPRAARLQPPDAGALAPTVSRTQQPVVAPPIDPADRRR